MRCKFLIILYGFLSSFCFATTIELKAQTLLFNLKNESFIAKSNVFFSTHHLSISCNHLSFNSHQSQVHAIGDIHFNHLNIQANTHEILYNLSDHIINISGTTSLTQGSNYLKGSHFMIKLDENTVHSFEKTHAQVTISQNINHD